MDQMLSGSSHPGFNEYFRCSEIFAQKVIFLKVENVDVDDVSIFKPQFTIARDPHLAVSCQCDVLNSKSEKCFWIQFLEIASV